MLIGQAQFQIDVGLLYLDVGKLYNMEKQEAKRWPKVVLKHKIELCLIVCVSYCSSMRSQGFEEGDRLTNETIM